MKHVRFRWYFHTFKTPTCSAICFSLISRRPVKKMIHLLTGHIPGKEGGGMQYLQRGCLLLGLTTFHRRYRHYSQIFHGAF